ncbi:clathrin light chain domain-containing protein [Ditylenchus destructor]|nr:clathrin light chain domain-containing protein [Ditylenchus destructor]
MSDPVSDFLQREQDALANLDGDGDDDFVSVNPVQNQQQHDGILNNAGDSGVDLSGLELRDAAPSPLQNGRGPSPANSTSTRGTSNGPHVEKEEPEKIRKWRENQKRMIEEKDKAEEKKKEELREHAKKELQEWHAQRVARLEQRKKDNREREVQHFEAYNGSGAKDANIKNTWERIAKMMESGSKSVRGTKDTTRMKSLVMSMSKENENGAE